ncbi:hypothetical protein AAZX31_07G220300 [Glycine max]
MPPKMTRLPSITISHTMIKKNNLATKNMEMIFITTILWRDGGRSPVRIIWSGG